MLSGYTRHVLFVVFGKNRTVKKSLKSSLRKYYGRYNDFLSKYNLTLGCMLTDVFYTNC